MSQDTGVKRLDVDADQDAIVVVTWHHPVTRRITGQTFAQHIHAPPPPDWQQLAAQLAGALREMVAFVPVRNLSDPRRELRARTSKLLAAYDAAQGGGR